jgi:hypothetical protein
MIASQTLLTANVLTPVYTARLEYGYELCAHVYVCNQDSGQWDTIAVAITRGSETLESKQYLYRGYSIKPNETKHLKLLLRENDTIHVQATRSRVSVNVITEEIETPRSTERLLGDRLDALYEQREVEEEVEA